MSAQSTASGRQDSVPLTALSGSFPLEADYLAAEANPQCLTASQVLLGARQIDYFVQVRDPGAATELRVKFRYSYLLAPDVADINVWGYVRVDNIDPVTGFSLTKGYEAVIDITNAPRTYLLRIVQISGVAISGVVWANGLGAIGMVFACRQGAT
jgi:hypothetical protein